MLQKKQLNKKPSTKLVATKNTDKNEITAIKAAVKKVVTPKKTKTKVVVTKNTDKKIITSKKAAIRKLL